MSLKNNKLNKCLQTLQEMFEYRSNFSTFFEELSKKNIFQYTNDINNERVFKIDFKNLRIVFCINDCDTITLKRINNSQKQLIEDNNKDINYYFFILSDPNAKKSKGSSNVIFDFMKHLNKPAEIFYFNELLYNISKNHLVPIHEIITNENEKNKIKNEYLIDNFNKLPWIRCNDPMSRFIGANEHDIIKITRFNRDAGTHILYRYCVNI